MFIGSVPDIARAKETVRQGLRELEMNPADQEPKQKTENMHGAHNGHAFI